MRSFSASASLQSHRCGAPPLLATPIATPLQCGRPKRPGLLFLKLLTSVVGVILILMILFIFLLVNWAYQRRSRTTLIEMNAFGSPTRMLVRHLHHTGEQRQVNDLQQPARKIEPRGVHRILR